MRGLLLAGGHGTRLRPLTSTGNKHMIPIANQPILFYALRQLAGIGIREVGVILGPIHEGIREGVGDGQRFGVRVTYIEQGPPKGLAHAVQCAREFLGTEPFVMYLGDNLLETGLQPFVDLFSGQSADAVVGVSTVSNPQQYGIVEVQGSRIVSIEEKPRRPKSNEALVGVYVFSPKVHEAIERISPSARGELEITDAIRRMCEAGEKVLVHRVHGWWKDTGGPEDLLEANDFVLRGMGPEEFVVRGRVDPRATVVGRVAVGEDSFIEEGASIEGPVVIGSEVQVGRNSSIGPGTSIGDHVSLRSCSVRRSIVLEGAQLRGPLRIRDSLIGRNAVVESEGSTTREVALLVGDASRIRLF